MLKVSKLAVRTDKTKGRVYKTNKDNFRNEYQRDVGRIIHSTAFRRLKYKTQDLSWHTIYSSFYNILNSKIQSNNLPKLISTSH